MSRASPRADLAVRSLAVKAAAGNRLVPVFTATTQYRPQVSSSSETRQTRVEDAGPSGVELRLAKPERGGNGNLHLGEGVLGKEPSIRPMKSMVSAFILVFLNRGKQVYLYLYRGKPSSNHL